VAEVLYYAAPAFVLLLVVEWISFVIARNEALVGYDAKDAATSLSMGIGNVVINVGTGFTASAMRCASSGPAMSCTSPYNLSTALR